MKVAAVRANLETYYSTNGVAAGSPAFQERLDPSNSAVLPQRQVAVALTPLSPATTAVTNVAGQIVFDRSGKFVYVIAGQGQNVSISAAFDATTGALIAVPGSPFSVTVGALLVAQLP